MVANLKFPIFQKVDATPELVSEDGIVSKINTINYDEQLRRVLRDTPSPEELSDDEDFSAVPPESPPEASKTKASALTAAEYFAASPLRSPLPVLRKRSSLLDEVKEEPE